MAIVTSCGGGIRGKSAGFHSFVLGGRGLAHKLTLFCKAAALGASGFACVGYAAQTISPQLLGGFRFLE